MEKYGFDKIAQYIKNINMSYSFAGIIELDKEWSQKNVSSSFTRIYIILDGEGFLEYENLHIKMIPKNVYIIPAGLNFSYRCDRYLKKIFLHINCFLPNNYDLFSYFGKILIFENQQHIISQLTDTSKHSFLHSLTLNNYVYSLIAKGIEENSFLLDRISFNYSSFINDVIKYIEKNLSANLSVSKIANDFSVSISTLQKKFKSEIGFSVSQYINDRLMSLAEKILLSENISLRQISDSLGFVDQFYFSRKFKQTFGVSPLKYKKLFKIK